MVLYAGLYIAGLQMYQGEQAVCDEGFVPRLHDYDVYDHLEAVCPPAFVRADVYLYALCAWPEHLPQQIFLLLPPDVPFLLVLTWSTAPMCAFSLDFQNMINSIMTGLFWLSDACLQQL